MEVKPTGEMEKFRARGLDCPHCALEIETALRRIDGFGEAVVSFGTGAIVIPRGGRSAARQAIARIEPRIRLVEWGDTAGKASPKGKSKSDSIRIARMALAAVLTIIGMALKDRLHTGPPHIAEYALFLTAYLLVGASVLFNAARNILRGRVFDELFLMSIATLGAIAIRELPEAVAVMFFYSLGEYIQDLAVGKSRRSIAALMNLRPDFARVVEQAHEESGERELLEAVSPESVRIGAIVEVRPGERVPLDGEVITGSSWIDTSALTGESVPRSAAPGETVLAGFVNDAATIRIRITKAFAESSVSRILQLVEDAAARKAATEKLISRFAAVYTPIVVAVAALVAFLPPLIVPGASLVDRVYRALVVLVISCPCALVISVPLGYFGGIGGASRRGILIKGANFIDALKDVSTVVVDKTGTLTRGIFQVTRKVAASGFTPEEVLRLAAAVESHSTHPIARSIREAYGSRPDTPALIDPREEKGFGVTARIGDRRIMAGGARLMRREGIACTPPGPPMDDTTDDSADSAGRSVVYVAVDRTLAGYLVITDEVKREAPRAVADMRELGVKRVVMLTGDNRNVAARVARDLAVDAWYAELLPEEKVAKVEELAAQLPRGERLAFVGDGINDAPVLMRADIGFAMGALGSDAAIEAADVVLMDDRVDGIASAIRLARHTRSVVVQNIVFALLVKLVFLGLGTLGIAEMWEAVIADMGVSVAAVLNATRTLRYSRRMGAAG